MIFIGLLIGLFIGGCVGVVVMAIVSISREERKGNRRGAQTMTFIQTIWQEMGKGNFSFAILIVGIIQVVLMIAERRKK